MNYNGKLYGRIGKKYFDTGHTSDHYDKLIAENKKMKELQCQRRELLIDFLDKIDFTDFEAGVKNEQIVDNYVYENGI